VIRIRPERDGVEPWICDRGRYVYDAFRSDERILEPRVRENGELVSSGWDDAMDRAASLLQGKKVGIVFSPDWSVEGLTSIRLLHDVAFEGAKVAFDLHRRDMRKFSFEEGLSMTTQQVEDAEQVVVLGSDLRQRLPLLMQRLRKRINAGRPVTRIGAMNYRTNTEPTKNALIRPRDWPAVIARAMEQVTELGKLAAGMDEWMSKVKERHEAGKLLADALISDSCALLVGEEIRAHQDAASLIYGLDLLMRACGHTEEGSDGRNLIPEGMNAQLLSAVFGDVRTSVGELFDAASNGELDALLLIGSDPLGDGLFPAQAKAAIGRVPLVQVGAISGQISQYAEVQLPAAAYSEIEGSFINMEGRVRVAEHPLKSMGSERPLWKVMMRLIESMGGEIPAVNMTELRDQVLRFAPELKPAWSEESAPLILPARNRSETPLPSGNKRGASLDIVSRYSLYREGAWARASTLLVEAGGLHSLDDVLVHPETLKSAGLSEGEGSIKTASAELTCHIGQREDVAPGVLFVAKRGVAGDLSSECVADLAGGAV
jgi:NADH-quinone oxidoreductase subunit G